MTQFLRIIQDDAYFSVGCIIVLILLTFYCHSWAESLFDDFLEGNVGKSKIRRIKKAEQNESLDSLQLYSAIIAT